MDRFEVALTRIREQAAFLGKEWMYTGAATSAQPQAATRYFLAAMAILDDALEAYIDKNWKEAPRDVSNLGKRIAFLKLTTAVQGWNRGQASRHSWRYWKSFHSARPLTIGRR